MSHELLRIKYTSRFVSHVMLPLHEMSGDESLQKASGKK